MGRPGLLGLWILAKKWTHEPFSSRPFTLKLFNSQDLICNSPYYLPYSSCDVSLEDLVLDQLIFS